MRDFVPQRHAPVEAPDGWKLVVLVLDVVLHRLLPRAIGIGDGHVWQPHLQHPDGSGDVNQAKPWMPESCGWTAAHDRRHPKQIRRPECQAGGQAIGISETRDPMVESLAEGVAQNSAATTFRGEGWRYGLSRAHGLPPRSSLRSLSSCSRTIFGPKRK